MAPIGFGGEKGRRNPAGAKSGYSTQTQTRLKLGHLHSGLEPHLIPFHKLHTVSFLLPPPQKTVSRQGSDYSDYTRRRQPGANRAEGVQTPGEGGGSHSVLGPLARQALPPSQDRVCLARGSSGPRRLRRWSLGRAQAGLAVRPGEGPGVPPPPEWGRPCLENAM